MLPAFDNEVEEVVALCRCERREGARQCNLNRQRGGEGRAGVGDAGERGRRAGRDDAQQDHRLLHPRADVVHDADQRVLRPEEGDCALQMVCMARHTVSPLRKGTVKRAQDLSATAHR